MRTTSRNKIAIVADWHRNESCIAKIKQIHDVGVDLIIHSGDLGIWHTSAYQAIGDLGPDEYVVHLEQQLAKYDMDLWLVTGNHESYDYIYDCWEAQGDAGRKHPLQLTPHLWILPRGYRFELRGVSFVVMGGANSIDRYMRTEHQSWWPQEQISDSDVNVTSAGGYADVMITHESPNPPYCTLEIQLKIESPSGWPAMARFYANFSKEQVTRALERVRPRLLFHGHWHMAGTKRYRLPDADHDTTTLSLGMEWQSHNIYILNLPSLTGYALP